MRYGSVIFSFLLACGSADKGPPNYFRDVKPIVDAKCVSCHQEGGAGPFPLDTYERLMAFSVPVRQAVNERVMPPWPASNACAEYRPNGALTDEQIQTLNAWLDAGALEGRPEQALPAVIEELGLSRVDLRLPMPEAYTPVKAPDEYRCFLLDWPETERRYITGFKLVPGHTAIVHHVNIFYVKPDAVPTFVKKDQDQAGPGYSCYSFPNPITEGGWIGTFTPGSLGADFPEGTGLHIEPGSKVLLQVHYNVAHAKAAPDQSVLELKLERSVRHEASIQAWADLEWISDDAMPIPAGAPDVVHRFSMDPTPYLSLANRTFLDGKPFKIYMATLHMHALGKSARLHIDRADGTTECIVDIPKWRYEWQLPYGLATPKVFNPGDRLTLECRWDNSAENQPIVDGVRQAPRDVNWGPNTSDEMCVGGLYISQ